MKDIKIDTPLMKFHYFLSWIGFIFGMLIGWIIAIFLAAYGKNSHLNTETKKGVLNKTWQKFVFIYGVIIGYQLILVLLIRFFLTI